jgi:inward rectifier potassium channel
MIVGMENPTFDPGLTQQFTAPLRRVINKDGSFNVVRRGTTWRDLHPYMHLNNAGWPWFLAFLFLSFVTVNALFALAYFSLGPGQLAGGDAPTSAGRFLNAFFFSAHTLSTVGYGNIAPKTMASNFLSAFEAMVGLMGFAVATGLLYGRFSRPSARIGFSPNMLVAPYRGGTSLQFRILNQRANLLMEVEAKVLLMTVEGPQGDLKRTYHPLTLERDGVQFLPLTWTVVHPIDGQSPLAGKTAADLENLQAEVLILIKGFDDTFSQTVHTRYSYRYDELLWGQRFAPAFHVDPSGDLVLETDKVGTLAPGVLSSRPA